MATTLKRIRCGSACEQCQKLCIECLTTSYSNKYNINLQHSFVCTKCMGKILPFHGITDNALHSFILRFIKGYNQ